MTVEIPGVPESITREAYSNLIRSLGLEPKELYELRFETKGIYATVIAKNADGKSYVVKDEIAMHEIVIPIKENA